jgi:hypothetical protein
MGTVDVVKVFFHMLMNLRLYHWQTGSYARHVVVGNLYDTLSDLIDKFVEVYMGRYGRPVLDDGSINISVKEMTDEKAHEYMQEYTYFLKKEISKHLKSTDTDLLNIRDEMLGEFNKVLYLFTLS